MLRGVCIRLIGNKKREKLEISKIKRIYIPGGRIGDVVVKTPMLEALSQMNSDVKIDIGIARGVKSLVETIPYINEIIEADKNESKTKIVKIWKQMKFAIKNRGKYDLYFDFTNNPRFLHLLSLKILSPRYIVGCHRAEKFGIKKDELTLFDKYVDVKKDSHATDINMDFIKGFDIDISDKKYKLYLGSDENRFENHFDRSYVNVILNYKGSSEGRTLKPEELEYFIANLPTIDKKIKLHIMSIPSEYEKIEKILKKLNVERVELLPKTEKISEAAGLIKYCDMFISVDTGVVHIASVYDKPILGIYPMEEKNFKLFEPRSSKYEIVRGKEEGNNIRGFSLEESLEKFSKLYRERE